MECEIASQIPLLPLLQQENEDIKTKIENYKETYGQHGSREHGFLMY